MNLIYDHTDQERTTLPGVPDRGWYLAGPPLLVQVPRFRALFPLPTWHVPPQDLSRYH